MTDTAAVLIIAGLTFLAAGCFLGLIVGRLS